MVIVASGTVRVSKPVTGYFLARIGLVRAACPAELEGMLQNRSVYAPIIVEKNRRKLGRVESTGYMPQAVVVAGAARRGVLLNHGVVSSWAWVENGAMNIDAAQTMSLSEFGQQLCAAALAKFYGPGKMPMAAQPWPSIIEVYPFQHYFVCSYKGEKYKQGFVLDPVERRVRLGGEMVKAISANNKDSMERVQTGVRYAVAPMKGNNQSTTTGGAHSELLTCILRNWANIEEAAAMYVDAIKHGLHKPMRPSFYPVNIDEKGHIAGALAAAGIDILDFAMWSVEARSKDTKSVGGKQVHRSKFAYVGDRNDPSTWHLPLDSPGRAQNALSRINQTKGIPPSAKLRVLGRVRHVAQSKGVGVSEKPTSGQQSWAHHGR